MKPETIELEDLADGLQLEGKLECIRRYNGYADQQKLLGQLVEAIAAKDELLICYRIGQRPSEKLFGKLDKAEQALAAAKKEGKNDKNA